MRIGLRLLIFQKFQQQQAAWTTFPPNRDALRIAPKKCFLLEHIWNARPQTPNLVLRKNPGIFFCIYWPFWDAKGPWNNSPQNAIAFLGERFSFSNLFAMSKTIRRPLHGFKGAPPKKWVATNQKNLLNHYWEFSPIPTRNWKECGLLSWRTILLFCVFFLWVKDLRRSRMWWGQAASPMVQGVVLRKNGKMKWPKRGRNSDKQEDRSIETKWYLQCSIPNALKASMARNCVDDALEKEN